MMEPTSHGSARPADDEVQQKQGPTEAGVSLTAICRYRENDCDVIYGQGCLDLQQGCLDAAATCSTGVWMLLQLGAGVFGCCCNLQQGCLDFS
ncbi:hypothetical protein Tco_0853858 [Tanacetum coccineum]